MRPGRFCGLRTVPGILFVLGTACAPLSAEQWNFASTQGLVVGVLQWRDPALSPFSDRYRKDVELYELLVRRGVPRARLGLLLDREATRQRIETALQKAASGAAPDSVFFFYYAGHGIKDESGAYIANYDINAESPGQSGMNIRRIAQIIAANFKGKRVIFSGDFCYSGAFEEALRILAAKGFQGAVVTSSSASNESTENWTFSQTLIDCLSGNPFCDRNADGQITLAEANTEIAEAMKARERQRNGFLVSGMTQEILLGPAAGKRPANAGIYVTVREQGTDLPARVLERSESKALCEFYTYSEKKSIWVENGRLKEMRFRQFPAGSTVQVLWHGKAYPARVLKAQGGFHLITYTGYDSSWDEWVMADRIKN